MTMTAYVNARLIDPADGLDAKGALLVEHGRIVARGMDIVIPEGAERIDCGGHILCPGLVDMRSFEADGASAIAGGITTVALMPDQSPPIDSAAMVDHMAAPEGLPAGPRVRPMGAATQGLAGGAMAEIGLMAEAGAVAFTDGRRAIADTQMMRRLLEYLRLFEALLVQHAEDPGLADGGVMAEGETATRLGLQGIPDVAEAILIERDARLCDLTGGRIHIAQMATRTGIDALRRLKTDGRPLTAGVSPQHFTLNDTAVGDYRTFARVSPPLRPEADRAALVEAIREGLIDVICSSHEPRDQDAKRLPFSEAAPGIVGYETLLPLSLALHHNHDLPLAGLLAMMTCNPARLLGLDAGTLAPGAPADLLVFDLDRPWRIDPERFRSRTQNTPFEGLPVQGKVLRTVVGGRCVYREDSA